MKDLEFYLNHLKGNCCMPTKEQKCLDKKNYLSEFSTDTEKEIARNNLGITEELDKLLSQINRKALETGVIIGDEEPIENNYDHYVTSQGLYREFQKYPKREEMETIVNCTWEHLVNEYRKLLKEAAAIFTAEKNYLRHDYDILKNEFDELKQLFETYVQTSSGGLAISNKFGNSNSISVSLKTLTEAINNIYAKISDALGEPNRRISITISPDYFISTSETCEANITINSSHDRIEDIRIYANNELIHEEDCIPELGYEFLYTLTGTTNIRVEAIILGKLYTEEKIINMYYPFFIGAGWIASDIQNPEYDVLNSIMTPENAIEFDGNLEGSYNVNVDINGKRIFVIVPKELQADIGRIHMNGYDIPFSVREDGNYIIYTSTNTYRSGNYTIYIENLK